MSTYFEEKEGGGKSPPLPEPSAKRTKEARSAKPTAVPPNSGTKTADPAKKSNIQWHAAAKQAFQLELLPWRRHLDFQFDHTLTTGSLAIDIIIIKKDGAEAIPKTFAALFRRFNIVEYKSPEDYISVEDFFKVHAYAYLYLGRQKGADQTNLTLTFIGSRTPEALLKYLENSPHYSLEKAAEGVYYVKGTYENL
jgi:hypothetical protein